LRETSNILGVTVGSVTLANELSQKLPAEFVASLPNGVADACAQTRTSSGVRSASAGGARPGALGGREGD